MVETQEPSLRSHEHLTLITNTVPALISYLDTDFRYQFCNAAYQDWFGLPPDRIIGRHVFEILGGEACESLLPYIDAALAGETQEFETEAKYAHGPWRWIHAVYRPHHDHGGKVIGLVIMVLDITDRKRAELALLQQRDIFEKMMSIETVGILFFDLRGNIQKANRTFERMCGYTLDELRLIDWSILTAPEFLEETTRNAKLVGATGKTPPYEKEMVRKDGSRWWGLFAPMRLSGTGPDSQCVEFIIDITQHKKYEQQLVEQARLLDLSTDAIISRDMDGRILFWSRGAERIYGWSRNEAMGRNVHELLKTQWPEPCHQIAHKLTVFGSWIGELIHTTRNGEHKIILCRKVFDRENSRVLETNTDVTQLRHAETALAEREAVLRSVAKEARVGLVMIDKDHRYIFANSRHSEILGLDGSNLEGKHVEDVVGELYEQMRPHMARAFAGERVSFELHIPRHPINGTERFCEVVYEPRLENPDEAYVVIVISDITDRKLAQQTLERTVAARTAELRETNEHLEAFVYSIAHDLRAPLRAMQGYSQILMDTAREHLLDQDKMFLERINRSAEFMDKMVLDLLAFGRTASTEITFSPVELQSVWHSAVEQTAAEIERTDAIIEIATPLCTVRAHEPTLTQIIANLLSNAVKFVEPGTQPRVRFGYEDKGRIAHIWIQDNGVGIAPEYHDRVFRVFERLHGTRYPGTGIGLAIVRKGVDRMNGKIGIESTPGKGTCFWIELPKA